jgi:drug/metabolite transporter (DMT)-like permease
MFQSVIVSFASFLAWCWLLRRYLASRLGVFSFLTPLLGVLLGAVLLGEMPSRGFLVGGVLVLAGIALVSAHGLLGGWLALRFTRPALAGPGQRMSESDKP